MNYKRILLLFLSLTLLLSLFSGCKGEPAENGYVPPEEKTLTIGDTSGSVETYNIIYSDHANETVKGLVKNLQADVKAASGVAPKFYTDTSKLVTVSPREILIGKTVRQESEDVLSRITGIGYRIERVDEKIVVAATNDNLLEEALEKLKTLLTVSDGTLTVTVGLIEKTSDTPVFPLEVDGKVPFRVVIPTSIQMGGTDALRSAAQRICDCFARINGLNTMSYTTDKTPANEGDYEICLGRTNREGSQKLYSELDSYFRYTIRVEGNCIYVGALLDSELVKGVNALYTELAQTFDGTYAGTPSLPLDFGGTYVSCNVSPDFPLPDDGTMKQATDYGRDSFILYYAGINEQSESDPEKTPYDLYIEKLQADGAEVSATYTLGQNSYTLLCHSGYTTYVSYLPGQKAMRIYVGPADDLNPPTEPVKDAKRVSPKLWSIQLANSGANGGMAYIIQLTDGKYLIFDGGCSSADSYRMLEVMKNNKLASQEKPIVAGWFISHLHEDHYGGLVGMAGSYADEIEVEAFYYNFPHVAIGSSQPISSTAAASLESTMRKWPAAKRYGKLHSGEVLYFSGANVNVLATLEDNGCDDGNDTSTVVQVEIAGQKILFLGDCEESESIPLAALGAEVLKSDIVQFSHHGYYDGASHAVYMLADPEYLLWPMCIMSTLAKERSNLFKDYFLGTAGGASGDPSNRWARTSKNIKEIIISGAGTICLNLPYTVGTSDFPGPYMYTDSGALIADYDAIYEAQLAEIKDNQ